MLTPAQVEHVKAERNALTAVDSPFIVTLFYSFQDDEYLYLVRVPALRRVCRLSNECARRLRCTCAHGGCVLR